MKIKLTLVMNVNSKLVNDYLKEKERDEHATLVKICVKELLEDWAYKMVVYDDNFDKEDIKCAEQIAKELKQYFSQTE